MECPICGGELRPFGIVKAGQTALHHRQSRCDGCGVLIANPRASEATRDRYYHETYYQEHWPNAEQVFAENIGSRTSHDFKLLRSIAGDILPAGGCALDVGCGYGAMIEILNQHGYRAVGCEVSSEAGGFARAKRLNVVRAKTPGLPFADCSWDLVVSSHVIEHVAEPRLFVQELVRLLKPGGCVALVTDHAHATQYALEHMLARMTASAPPFRTSPDHTFVFGARHLRELLTGANCTDLRHIAYHYPPGRENWHWRAYKGLCRAADRALGWGQYQLAVARRG